MRKGYERILGFYEKEYPEEMSISKVVETLPKTTEHDLLSLGLAGFLDNQGYKQKDKKGDTLYKLSKEGFSHLNGLRALQIAKETKRLTNVVIGLTFSLIILGFVQTFFTILQYLKP